jgi:hypothetical protein
VSGISCQVVAGVHKDRVHHTRLFKRFVWVGVGRSFTTPACATAHNSYFTPVSTFFSAHSHSMRTP